MVFVKSIGRNQKKTSLIRADCRDKVLRWTKTKNKKKLYGKPFISILWNRKLLLSHTTFLMEKYYVYGKGKGGNMSDVAKNDNNSERLSM